MKHFESCLFGHKYNNIFTLKMLSTIFWYQNQFLLKVNWSICNCPTFAKCQHIIMSIANIFHTILLQRHPDGQKAEICETSPRLAAAQIGESCSCTQGCVWLCCYVSQKCDEYLNCILALSVNLCHGRGSVVQRKIFPLLRRFCTWWKGVPVSYLLS